MPVAISPHRTTTATSHRGGHVVGRGTKSIGDLDFHSSAPSHKRTTSGSSSGSSKCFSISGVRTCLIVAAGTVLLGLFRIESILYRDFRDNTRRAEQKYAVVAKALRHSTSTSTNEESRSTTSMNANTNKHSGHLELGLELGQPTKYYYKTQGSLRSPTDAQTIISQNDINLPRPRTITIALNENMRIVVKANEDSGIITISNGSTSSTSEMARQMELEETATTDTSQDNGNGDDNADRYDFERLFYEKCDPVLMPLPSVHPTCNNIHELSLLTTTSKNEGSLLSMKGSWRSVWKIELDGNRHNNNETMVFEQKKNEASIPFNYSNATIKNSESAASGFSSSSSSSSVVLKMLHFHRQFDRKSFEAHATDIIVMDRLTASPYVVDAYSFCGQSVVTEFAKSSGRDYVKRYDIGSRDRLRIARDLARGLADIQALQALHHAAMVANATTITVERGYVVDGQAPTIPIVFAHNDITIANTVMVGEKIKWNDFNIGVFMRKERIKDSEREQKILDYHSNSQRHQRPPNTRSNSNIDNNQNNIKITSSASSDMGSLSPFNAFTNENRDNTENVCPAPVKFRSDMWRSPEEIRNSSYVQMTQTDMYGLGNIIYQTMTRHQPWSYKEPGGALTKTDVALRKLNGTIPTIPEQYLNTTKRELQSLFAATNLCFFSDPRRRPTARRMAYGLGSLYNRLKHKQGVTRQMILDYLVAPN